MAQKRSDSSSFKNKVVDEGKKGGRMLVFETNALNYNEEAFQL